MAEIIFFGTCAGTEPMPGMHHASLAVEKNGCYYWFDAGEGCSRTAHLMGIDMSGIKSVFISHPHIDHLGGLLNVFWTIRKLAIVKKTLPPERKVDLYISDMNLWHHFDSILKGTECSFDNWFAVHPHGITDGLIYQDENLCVEAMHNHHMEPGEDGAFRSYSFRITVDEKIIVYSGDVRNMVDLERIIGGGCDYLIMETGHHRVTDVCKVANERPVGRLLFTHHGRAIINDVKTAEEEMKICTKNPLICRDRMRIEI